MRDEYYDKEVDMQGLSTAEQAKVGIFLLLCVAGFIFGIILAVNKIGG
jgi:hypothetical protein